MLLPEVRIQLTDAMRRGQDIRKGILRLVLSEAAQTNVVEDNAIRKIMRKMIERNHETLSFLSDKRDPRVGRLEEEISILERFLPRMLHTQEIRSSLSQIQDQLRACPKEGAAVGLAMKRFQALGDDTQVDGEAVREVVMELRANK